MNRLLIYFFYDRDGIVDRYVEYMLAGLKEHVNDCVVVCNGNVNEKGKAIFEKYSDNIIIRENKGFDVWAYKTALETVGWDKLEEYDEVILMNFTIMGPLYPFSEMFQKMDEKDVDFWGLTLFHQAPFDPFGKIKYGYLPLHLQSHFIAVRKEMIKSSEFQQYWNEMPMINSYEEAVCWHEAIFTKTFEDLGYKWDVYMDTRDMTKYCYCPILFAPMELVKNRRCPIIKRRNFFHDYNDILEYTTGEVAIEVFNYIKNNLDYNEDFILESLIRLENQADFKKNLHYNYILPTNTEIKMQSVASGKTALVIHQYFMELIEYCYEYALAMPDDCDIFITTNTEEKKEAIEKVFSKGPWNSVKVIVIPNRGRDVSSLLLGAKEFCSNYDYVCFVHDKKVQQLDFEIKGESFSYKCFENLLKNKKFVHNVIATFEENPRLGMLLPPPPNFAEYYPTIGRNDWGVNLDGTIELAEKLGIHVKMEESKEPIAPLGTMFWFRPKALKDLFEVDWNYNDFPEEPNKTDGTLLHFVERLYPFAVQNQGYYPAWLMNAEYASVEIDNLYFMLREMNRGVFDIVGPNTHKNVIHSLKVLKEQYDVWNQNQRRVQLFFKQEGLYTEEHSIIFKLDKDTVEYEFTGLESCGCVEELRLDPDDNSGISMLELEVEVKKSTGEIRQYHIKDVKTNGVKINEHIVFLAKDPQMYLNIGKASVLEYVKVKTKILEDIQPKDIDVIQSRVSKKGLFNR